MSVPPTPADRAAAVRVVLPAKGSLQYKAVALLAEWREAHDALDALVDLAARADELERERDEARFPEIDESLLPDHVISASWSPEVLAAAAQAHCRHQWDHDMEVKAWVVLTLLRDRERAERAEEALRAAEEVDALVSVDGPPFTFDGQPISGRGESALLVLHDCLTDARAALGEQP